MAAAMKPSSRSMKPPWPGIRPLESLMLKRRLIQDLNRSPPLRQRAGDEAEQKQRPEWRIDVGPDMRRERPESGAAERRPPRRPDQGLARRNSSGRAWGRRSTGRRNRRRHRSPRRRRAASRWRRSRRTARGASGDRRQQQAAGAKHARRGPQTEALPRRPGAEGSCGERQEEKGQFGLAVTA